jgi:outer membrane lipoprotein LolB
VNACIRTSTSLKQIALLLITAAACAGCATDRGLALPEMSNWQQRQAVLIGLDQFEFRGRVGVKAGDDGFNGKLRWSQDKSQFQATLSGPLGIGTVRIDGDDALVKVTDNDGRITVLHEVEPDLYARYGWTIPVQSLRYWALGIPAPGAAADTEFAENGDLQTLRQRGWTVEFSRYRIAGGGQPMPGRLTAQNADTSVRLVIDEWVFH